jgi:hypothetical protein
MRPFTHSQIDLSVMAITTAEVVCRHATPMKKSAGASGQPQGEMAMLSVLTFAVVAVALGMPFVVPLMWGRIEQAYP